MESVEEKKQEEEVVEEKKKEEEEVVEEKKEEEGEGGRTLFAENPFEPLVGLVRDKGRDLLSKVMVGECRPLKNDSGFDPGEGLFCVKHLEGPEIVLVETDPIA